MVLIRLTVVQLLAVGWIWGTMATCLALYFASDIKLALYNRKVHGNKKGHGP